ncbi:hypothetical protein CP967_23410 [Streptomyces nitrosporeus]|uniref:Uncharacterized protein n=1 Tax=Streptomyces nitrosporeus TaxID=28894 RepID=A0A5J6FLB1_9ACTN|nr:hypothetical protein CP967_23410 [Streptomyces nitrosporeus]
MRRGHLGRGVRLAHDPQAPSIVICRRPRPRTHVLRTHVYGNEKSPRTGGDAAPSPTRHSHRSVVISAAR